MTILAWATTASHNEDQILVNYYANASAKLVLGIHSSALWVAGNYISGGSKCNLSSSAAQNNQWQFLAGTYTSTVSKLYFGQNAPSEGATAMAAVDGVQLAYRTGAYPWHGNIRYIAVLDRWMSHAEYLMLYADPAALLRKSRRKVLWVPSGGAAPGTYTGAGAATAQPPTAAGVGTHTTPVYSGVGASAAQPATASGVGVYSTAVYSGAGAATAQHATAAGVGTYTTPVYMGVGAAYATAAVGAGIGEFIIATYTGVGASTAQPATAAGAGTYTRPVIPGDGTVTSAYWDLLAWLFRWRGGWTPIAGPCRVAACGAWSAGAVAACGHVGPVAVLMAGQSKAATACGYVSPFATVATSQPGIVAACAA